MLELILELFGTILFIIILLFAGSFYWKIIKPFKELVIIKQDKPNGKIDIIVPGIYPELIVENTRHLVTNGLVNKIFIITPKKGRIIGKYADKYEIIKDEGKGRSIAINSAIDKITSEYTLVLDEDLHVPYKSIENAMALLQRYDILKLVLRPKLSSLSLFQKLIKIERLFTETIQQPKSTPFFSGTGFFKTKVLKDLKFDNSSLTEDIELSVRAYKKGYRIGCFNEIIGYEDYPSFKGWLIQRRRWAAGWFQVFKRHLGDIRNKNVLKLMGTQPFTFIPPLLIIGSFTGNLFNYWTSILLSIFAISPFFIIGLKFDKKIGLLFPFYMIFLIFYSFISCIYPPKRYHITPKDLNT